MTSKVLGLTSRLFGITLVALSFSAVNVSLAQPADSLRIVDGGLVAYNQVTNRLGEMPVTVGYLRGTFREIGRDYLWPNLEKEPGVYDFSPFTDALDEAQRIGVRLGVRIVTAHPFVEPDHPVYPFFPEWIPYKAVTRERTAYAPDWEDPAVQEATRNLLLALGDEIGSHPALLFVDVGVLGWVGEWHTTVGFRNSDFMPSLAVMKQVVDDHLDAFGADKLLLNLGAMPPEVLSYGLSRGITGLRQDCFGSTYHMQRYELKLQQVPELARAIETGMVFFEVCGDNMASWTHEPGDRNGVTLPIEEIVDRGIRWKTTMFGNMGTDIPVRYMDEYMRLHRAMASKVKGER